MQISNNLIELMQSLSWFGYIKDLTWTLSSTISPPEDESPVPRPEWKYRKNNFTIINFRD